MSKLKDRQKADRERLKRWREKQGKQGKKSVNIVISKEAHEYLVQEKEDTGDSYSVIIERALMESNGDF